MAIERGYKGYIIGLEFRAGFKSMENQSEKILDNAIEAGST